MANLLQKASIVLTPTAYDNGKVLCAKPSEPPYGDFDFSRNSAATRVNAQGLVENVQILSSNLVQNGDFSEEGVQEISNGSFSQEGSEIISAASWSNQTSGTATISNGVITFVNGTGYLTQSGISANKFYKFVVTLSNVTQGSFRITTEGSVNTETLSTNGVHEFYLQSTSAGGVFIIPLSNFTGSIDNVSVREVGQDWTLGTGWSIGEDKAIYDNSGSGNLNQSFTWQVGKTYKITFDIGDFTTSQRFDIYSGVSFIKTAAVESDTSYTIYFNGDGGSTLRFRGLVTESFSITNISVKEVGQNWSVKSGEVLSVDSSGLVFDNSTGNGSAGMFQNIGLSDGKTYTMTATMQLLTGPGDGNFGLNTSTATGSSQSRVYLGGPLVVGGAAVTETFQFTPALGDVSVQLFCDENNSTFKISNISVIEITDDTNLPRINYEGFSYQDALGSEEITNGDFATDSDWIKQSSWTISNGTANYDGLSSHYIQQSNVFLANTNYKITFTISNNTSGIISIRDGSAATFVGNTNYSNGTYSFYITSNANTSLRFYGVGGSGSLSIDNVSVKEYLGQEVVPDSGCGSWLFEPQTSQLVTYSEDFSNAVWAKGGDTTIESGYLAPDGTNSAYKVSGTDSSMFAVASLLTTTTRSIYARTVSGTGQAHLLSYSSNSNNLFTITDQWQRFDVNSAIAAGASNFYAVDFRNQTTLSEIIIWGANATNDQDYATSYIPTSGSTVTRNQDLCTNGGSLASINSTEGVLYAEIAALANGGLSRYIALSNGSNNERVQIIYSSTANYIVMNVVSSNSVQAQFTVTVPQTQYNKLAISYKANDVSFWLNGIKVHTDTNATMPIGLNVLEFQRPNNTSSFFGKTKALAVWKEALSDQELADLTYPTPTDPTFALDFDTIATDFTFARGSEATYVDAQGLIKSTNEIGEELITNGDFSNGSTDWSLGAGVSISSEKAVLTNVSNATQCIIQNNVVVVGKTYKITFTISDYNQGAVYVLRPTSLGSGSAVSANGTFSFTMEAQTSTAFILFTVGTTTLSIDNVSVKEVITATNTPRLDYSTGAEAFLLEPQSTNLITYSEDFSNASWTAVNTTITSDYGISPDGTNNSTRLVFGSGTAYVNRSEAIGVGDQASSIYVKGISGQILKFGKGANVGSGTNFTLNGDWQRLEQISTNSGTAYHISSNIGGANATEVEVWGAMLENQSYATSYIPTSGTTVTRNQETCINATPEINSEEGVLYAEIAALTDGGTFRAISLNDGTTNNNNVIRIYCASADNRITIIIRSNGILVLNYNHTLTSITDFNKIAIKYKQNDFSLWVNGVNIHTETTGNTPIGLNELVFNNGLGTELFFGNTKDVQVYTKALSDAELIKLTT